MMMNSNTQLLGDREFFIVLLNNFHLCFREKPYGPPNGQLNSLKRDYVISQWEELLKGELKTWANIRHRHTNTHQIPHYIVFCNDILKSLFGERFFFHFRRHRFKAKILSSVFYVHLNEFDLLTIKIINSNLIIYYFISIRLLDRSVDLSISFEQEIWSKCNNSSEQQTASNKRLKIYIIIGRNSQTIDKMINWNNETTNLFPFLRFNCAIWMGFDMSEQ